MLNIPFLPNGAASATPNASAQVAATGTVAQITLPSSIANGVGSMRVVVSGSQNIAWCYGNNGNLTMSNGVFMLANTVETFSLPAGVTQISVIAAGAGSTVIASVGDGQ